MNSFLLFDVCVRHEGNKLKGSLVIFMTLNPDKDHTVVFGSFISGQIFCVKSSLPDKTC